MAKIGDYVTGTLIGEDGTRQGVLIYYDTKQSIVLGQRGVYLCQPSVTPVENILFSSTVQHLIDVRQALKEGCAQL